MSLQDCEQQIRQGKFDEVRAFLKAQNLAKLTRTESLSLANFARRTGLFSLAVRALWPIVRAQNLKISNPTDQEVSEYAVSLYRLGAIREAEQLLHPLVARKNSESMLYLAWCHFNQWECGKALPLLREYIQQTHLTAYQSVVGRVNLAAALVILRQIDEAKALLTDIRQFTKDNNHHLLYGNSLELSAQSAMQERDFSAADQFLNEGWDLLKDSQSAARLYLMKWRAALKYHRFQTEEATQDLNHIRTEALHVRDFETLRECDRLQAQFQPTESIVRKLFFGTPYEGYRSSLISDGVMPAVQMQDFYLHPERTENVIDLKSAKLGNENFLEEGRSLHRLLITLSLDIYKPQSIGTIFSWVYPNQFYDPLHSPNRLHQQIHRLKKVCSEYIEVGEVKSRYFVQPKPGYCFLYRNEPAVTVAQREEVLWQQLLQHFQSRSFRTSDVEATLQVSNSTATRLLRWALQNHRVIKNSGGPFTTYVCQIEKLSA